MALLLFLFALNVLGAESRDYNASSRCDFAPGFIFGAASSAAQVEGASAEGGRTHSIWDTFAHTEGKISDGSTGDVAADQYHRYKEDVQLLKHMGMDAYRFSISWSRIFPDGGDVVNPEGLNYYNALIDELLQNGIQPFVTIYHWDLPQELEDKLGGWMNSDIVPLFVKYAERCFTAFGDRVKHWVTINEPEIQAVSGYALGFHAPGRCLVPDPSCIKGNISDVYLVAHNLLLAHAAASKVYKDKFQEMQQGRIGLVVYTMWAEPASPEDREASEKALDFFLGWILNPLFRGDYPSSMRVALKDILPRFTDEQRQSLVGSIDFLGLNHYTSSYVRKSANNFGFVISYELDGTLIGPKEASDWFYVVPWGLRKLLNRVRTQYGNPPVYVTENGMEMFQNETVNDARRVDFLQAYISSMLVATKDGANVLGYFVWSFLDAWEWSRGHDYNFGLYYVDRNDGLKRYPKLSANWFRDFLTSRRCTGLASS